MVRNVSSSAIYITGLSHAYPPYSLDAQEFTELIARLYPGYSTSPGYIHPTPRPHVYSPLSDIQVFLDYKS
jgi:hypothetical protein